jgi:hypothetical protein
MSRTARLLAVFACLACTSLADARPWKPTPQQEAQDYALINHNKGGAAGRVIINWIAAPGFSGTIQQLFEKYVVISITHSITSPGGLTEYDDIEGVQVTDQAGHELKPVNPNDYPPTLVSILAGADATMRQSTQGRGKNKTLVFEAGAVHACDKNSGLIVLFEGEKYTWQTPFPGCTDKS